MGNMGNWLEIAAKLRSEGSLEETIAFLSAILNERPNDPLVHYQIAWTHDVLGKESDAVLSYEKAIALGLAGSELEGAYLGLGSTYRCLGDYQNSERVLSKAISLFPENGALKAFFAITQYNMKNYSAAMKLLVTELVRTSTDDKIKSYSRALLFYADKLDEVFD